MEYMVEPIGAMFATKDLPKLAELFSARAKKGYQLHSVFQVSQPGGCMQQPTVTYLAIYQRTQQE